MKSQGEFSNWRVPKDAECTQFNTLGFRYTDTWMWRCLKVGSSNLQVVIKPLIAL